GPNGRSGGQIAQRPIVIVLRAEPPMLNDRLDRMGLRSQVTVTMATRNDREVTIPILAERLPSQSDRSWTVNSDGTMRTIYSLRPNLLWQDGQPLTASDFTFAYRVYTDNAIPVTTRLPETLMSEVIPRDDRTVEIVWREPYVDAGALIQSQLAPLPAHLLEDLYGRDKTAFATSTFWTSEEFVSDGPYRVNRWEHGVAIYLEANPYFVFGPPKIDRIEIRAVTDGNTVVAGFLAGSIDFSEYTAIDVDQAVTLRDRWQMDQAGKVYSESLFGTRYMEFQHREVPGWQRALEDVRVRQALGHSLDRTTLAEALQHGFGDPADTGYPRSAAIFPRIDQTIAKYPYDLRRAQELLGQAGWTKGGDGLYRDTNGRPLDVEVRVTGEREDEATLIDADWRKSGISASIFVVPRAQTNDVEFRVNFPGVATSATTDVVAPSQVTTSQAPTAANKFTGKNRGSYSNPELDRLYDLSLKTLDAQKRDDILVDLERLYTSDVAHLVLYYQPRAAASRGIEGIKPPVRDTYLWNLWEWTLQPVI
ncbi:MAG TPA: ABC transporter substrate-binding protein, partial [Chloroflexota bacterium]